ncbi:MAG: cardiolipin synthase [Firmicutes bacterium]|nr:cardiolipin synthase [Bacillota bacterium]
MRKEHKRKRNSISRLLFVGLAIVIQVAWLIVLAVKLNAYSTWISLFTTVLSILVVLRLSGKHTSTAMKMPWIMLILAVPVMGLSLFLLFEILGDPGKAGKRIQVIRKSLKPYLPQNPDAIQHLEEERVSDANQFRYLSDHEQWPVYENTAVQYFGDGAQTLEAMKADLEKAEKFIFMEYFIVADNSSFREIREILVRKVRQGVQVRLMYDDIGSIGFVNMKFAESLNEDGICCRVFNPAVPLLNLFLNHRDHRKTTVIDGKVGYTGGYNLSDEYFGRAQPYGLWKDTGVRLEGEAVRSLTASFLELWGVTTKSQEDCGPYLSIDYKVNAPGFVQPFNDNPLSEERTAENVYLNLISQAEKTLYFTTPYLIITDEMSRALRLAAKRGVDVRIITPGIPDKKVVFAITRSYYAGLARQGVRIYEYTPGFCHAKQCLCDGRIASIGSSNLDYRSLYHHFENDVLLCGCDAIDEMAKDFDALFAQCTEVTEKYSTGRGAMLRIGQCILRLFAPLV